MDGKRIASALRARSKAATTTARDAISTAQEAVADARQASAEARERVQEMKALIGRIHAERERDAVKKPSAHQV